MDGDVEFPSLCRPAPIGRAARWRVSIPVASVEAGGDILDGARRPARMSSLIDSK